VTARTHNIASRQRMQIVPVLRAIAESDLVASGGGSLLQDTTSEVSLFYYLAILRAAQIMNKKTMVIAQGIGPLNTGRSRRLTARVLKRTQIITVRDEQSASLLRDIGVTDVPIEVTADPALLLGTSRPDTAPSKRLAISLRPWKHQTEQIIQAAVDMVGSLFSGWSVASIAMQPGMDTTPMEQFLERLPDSVVDKRLVTGSYDTCLDAIRASDLTIGMRLHSLIFAAACHVPTLAISYDPKVDAFMQQINQTEFTCPISSLTTSRLCDTAAAVMSNLGSVRDGLCSAMPSLRAKAQRNGDIAVALAAPDADGKI
jgi:polysaccharide pyruvyl transferase CsaB